MGKPRARSSGAADGTRRIRVALACSVCGTRNYRTTKATREGDPINLKKFCSHCNQHTVHIEGK